MARRKTIQINLAHVRATGGEDAASRFKEAQSRHEKTGKHARGGGCPGMREIFKPPECKNAPAPAITAPGSVIPSELNQWPIQLHLVRPGAPYFKDRELLLLNSCGAVASADVHWRYLRGRAVVIACPKLDRTEGYVEKLAEILRDPSIPRILIVRMEVPCCGGLTNLARRAVELCGRKDIQVDEIILNLNGEQSSRRALCARFAVRRPA